jgi:hypothetical protein
LFRDKPIVLVRIHASRRLPLVYSCCAHTVVAPMAGDGPRILISEVNAYLRALRRDIVAMHERTISKPTVSANDARFFCCATTKSPGRKAALTAPPVWSLWQTDAAGRNSTRSCISSAGGSATQQVL